VSQEFYKNISGFRGEKVIVAFSGGPDSVVLAYMVEKYKKLFSSVTLAHYNHNMRVNEIDGVRETDRDEEFSRKFAADIGIEFVTEKSKSELKSEKSARDARMGFLQRLAGDDTVILTGHHADDVAETLLMRMIRGAALRGLAVLPRVRSLNGIVYASPLQFMRKIDIESFISEKGLAYCTDSTNGKNTYFRNKVRSKIMPAIVSVCPEFSHRAVFVRDALSEDAAALDELSDHFLNEKGGWYDAAPIRDFSVAVATNLVYVACRRKGLIPERREMLHEAVNMIKKSGEKKLSTFIVESDGGRWRVIAP